MLTLPSPLHPAIVHFPIVLILIGTAAAVAAVFIRRWHLPLMAALLLSLGAAGAIAATWSGGEEEEMLGELSPQAEEILDEHEEWGERTRNLALITAVLACTVISVSRFPVASRALSIVTALLAIVAAYAVAETGHYGGQLVYKHGAGINTAAGAAARPESTVKPSDKDDDD